MDDQPTSDQPTSDQPTSDQPTSDQPTSAEHAWPVRADVLGTALFALALAVTVPLRNHRPAQVLLIVVSMTLFAIGAAGCLTAYVRALDRSRTDEIGVANLFLLTGRTAPASVKRTMSLLLAMQVVLSLAAAIYGAVGLSGTEVNALAFGILVPMFGLAMNGLWAVRHGRFGRRLERSVQPSNRRID